VADDDQRCAGQRESFHVPARAVTWTSYQMGGSPSSRWVSLASSGFPFAVCMPLTTQFVAAQNFGEFPPEYRVRNREHRWLSSGEVRESARRIVAGLAKASPWRLDSAPVIFIHRPVSLTRVPLEPSLGTLGSPITKCPSRLRPKTDPWRGWSDARLDGGAVYSFPTHWSGCDTCRL